MKIRRHWNWDRLMMIIWLIMALPVGILFFVHLHSDLKLKVSGIETVWAVTNVKTEYRTNDVEHYSVSIKYDCWSKEWVESNVMRWSSNTYCYEIGDEIVLYCDENEPEKFMIKEEFLDGLPIVLFFFVPWFIIFLIWIIRVKRQNKQKKVDQELKQFGTKVEATIVDISQSGINFAQKLWFKITAEYWENMFISEDIYANIYYFLDIWDKIDVYLDNEDHSKYCMDVDSILEKNDKVLNVVANKKWGELIIYWMVVLIMSLLFMYENNWLDLTSRLSLFISLLFIVAICLIWFWVKRVIKQKNREKLEQSGTKLEATVLLELKIPITRNRHLDYKYKIVAKYNKETFLSDEYSKSINNKIKKWAKIDVYLDESDHSRYWMDMDSISEIDYDNTMIIN